MGSAIRRVLAKCIICRRLNALPVYQQMADLPHERISPDEPPFTRVGVDCFGPFEVKSRRSMVKKYGVLFTCLAIRAVHMKLHHRWTPTLLLMHSGVSLPGEDKFGIYALTMERSS